MAAELTDAQVFGSQPEMTDAQVFGQPQAGDGKSLADVITSPDALTADMPQSQKPTPPAPSLTDLRDRIQQGDISVLKSLAPGPDAGPIERGARYAAMTGVHGLASLIQYPINQLIGVGQGTGGLTINPATNTLGQTPESLAATSLFASPLRFSGTGPANQFVPPGSIERAPIPGDAAANIINPDAAARIRAAQGEPVPVAQPTVSTPFNTPPPSGSAPVQPQPQPASTAAPQAPATSDTTGLVAGVGGMGKGISDSLRNHLWDQLQKGDLTEAGAPSTILQTAKANMDSGAIKTRADFDRFYEEYGNRMAAQRQGQQPPPQPDATAPPQPAAAPAPAGPTSLPTGVPVNQMAPTIAADGSLTPPQPPGPAVPTTSDGARAIAKAYYDRFDKAAQDGGSLNPQATDRFIASVEAAAPPPGIGQAVAGKNAITDLVERLQDYKGQPMSLQDAHVVDQQLGNLISAEYGRTGVSSIGRQMQDIQQKFRDQLSNPEPGDVVSGQAGLDALAPARKAYSQAMKLDTIERIQERADMTDNPTTSFRTQIRTLLTNDRLSRGFSDEEKTALQDAANRGVTGQVLHLMGSRLIPIITGSAGGGLAGAALGYGLNEAARAGQNALAARRLQNAYTILGKSVPPNPSGP